MEQPLLATSTDGVGTKVAIAQRMDIHDTIGIDLVGMVVDDLVVCGAEPLFMTDYIATGKVVPEQIAAIVAGIAEGARQAGCALVGGETAEHPGLLAPGEYDIAGAATGVVDAPNLLGPELVQAGDVVVAMAASGLHSNGYSLVRHVFFTLAGWDLAPPRRRARPHARRGDARPDPHLRAGLPRGRARRRDPRVLARHRRRAREQPRAGAARAPVGDARPLDLGAPADLRPRRRGRRRRARRARAHAQHGRRHGRDPAARTRSTRRSRCSRRAGCPRGSPVRSPRATAPPTLVGDYRS